MRRGLLEGVLAYILWGLSPIFWKQLASIDAIDVVAHRVMWTSALLAIAHTLSRSWPRLIGAFRHPKAVVLMAVSGALLSLNWLVFVWAVAHDRVLEASLGYFILPLFAVVLGVVVLGERLVPIQWVAVGIAAIGVGWMTVEVGELPWVSLILAVSFSLYGLIRKVAKVDSFDGLSLEMLWLFVPGVLYVLTRAGTGEPRAVGENPSMLFWLSMTAFMTAVPLLLFASAARRIPLSTLG